MKREAKSCPLCKKIVSVEALIGTPVHKFKCPICGIFNMSNELYNCTLDNNKQIDMQLRYKCKLSDVLFRASCIAAEKKIKSEDGFTLILDKEISGTSISIFDFIKDFPEEPTEQFDRALLSLGRMAKTAPFKAIKIFIFQKRLLFLHNNSEFPVMMKLLEDNLFIKVIAKGDAAEGYMYQIAITVQGWKRITELTEHSKRHSNKAFVAMWFDKSTEAFREAVRRGVDAAGYEMIVVDEAHHNGFIMDKVLNSISESKFIIADFTCEPEKDAKKGVRGGVYYEAGFAAGQGKEVIMTCCDIDHAKDRIHFDMQQKNTIFWTEENGKVLTYDKKDNLADLLKERIIRTVGKGSNYSEE